MFNIFQISFLFLFTSSLFSQKDSVYIVKLYDKMTKETFFQPKRSLALSNKTKDKGFIITPSIRSQDTLMGLILVEMVGLGNCNEDNKVIILFENDETITKSSIGSFNCKGYFGIGYNDKDEKLYRETPIKSIRVTNGHTGDFITLDVAKKDKRYFIQLFKSIDSRIVK